MLIGELSKRTGLSRDTIRFYEKQGLITVSRNERRDNNYKEYSESNLKRLKTIMRIKSFGFTLNETADLLLMMELNKATCTTIAGKVSDKVSLIDRKINELLELKIQLTNMVEECPSCGDSSENNCPALVQMN